MFYVTSDYHGGLEREKFEPWEFPDGVELTRDDYVIILGDFGLPWNSSRDAAELRFLEEKPWTTLFIDGNHEQFPFLDSIVPEPMFGGMVQRYPDYPHIIHLMCGQVYRFGTVSAFCMGGATSIDRDLRIEGETWFGRELPSSEEYAIARDSLDKAEWYVDYVLTHTCATRVASHALYPESSFSCPASDDLTDFLDGIEDELSYKRWYFGHFHKNASPYDERHTLLYDAIVPLGASLHV